MSSVLVAGGSGFLGQSLTRLLGRDGLTTYRSQITPAGIAFDAEKTPFREILSAIPDKLSHVVVTYGAINPEFCARDPEASARINVTSVIDTMRDAMDAGLTPVFLSTDYVFDGAKGARGEDEVTCPTTQYGIQKVAVEDWLQSVNAPWLIVRASKLVSGARNTHSVLGQWLNDIEAGREMRCADDQIFSPALVDDTAAAILQLIRTNCTGIFHVAGDRAMSRYDLADTLCRAVSTRDKNIEIKLSRAKLADFPFLEKRPLNTSLSTKKFRALSLHPFQSMESLCTEVVRADPALS